jgi:mRNA interferase HigB
MKISGQPDLDAFSILHSLAARRIERWLQKTKAATWKTPVDVKKTFPSADFVKVKSGATAVVFNLGGNNFRLIASVRYDLQRVIVLRIYTHQEYFKYPWIDEL